MTCRLNGDVLPIHRLAGISKEFRQSQRGFVPQVNRVASRPATLQASQAARKGHCGKTPDKWLNVCLVLAMFIALAIWARTMIEMTAEVFGLMNLK